MNINTRILRGFLACVLLVMSLPVFAQKVRFIWQGAAYAFAEDQWVTERVIDQVVGAPIGEGAQVVFFRPNDERSEAADLSEGDASLAQIPGGAYYAIAATPGTHTYVVNGSPLQVQLAPGQRRFVRISNRGAGPTLLPTNALTFLRLVFGKRPPLY